MKNKTNATIRTRQVFTFLLTFCSLVVLVTVVCFSECQPDWISFRQSCYRIGQSEAAMTWYTAVDKCSENHSHLVHIKSVEVTDFIHTLLWQSQLGNDEAVYIGKCCILI